MTRSDFVAFEQSVILFEKTISWFKTSVNPENESVSSTFESN